MSTYHISRDNNALVNIGSGDFHITTSQEGVLYVVPVGTPLADCATASVGTYAVSLVQSNVYVPENHLVCVISAYRDVEMFVSPVHQPGAVPVEQRTWIYSDFDYYYAGELRSFAIGGPFRRGNYNLVVKGYTKTNVNGAILEFIVEVSQVGPRFNFGVPTSFVNNSTWQGSEINVNSRFFIPGDSTGVLITLENDTIIKPMAWIERLD